MIFPHCSFLLTHTGGCLMLSGVTPQVWQGSQGHSVSILVPSKLGQTSSISAGLPQCSQGQGESAADCCKGVSTTGENSSLRGRTMRMSRTFMPYLSGGNCHATKVSPFLKPCETFVVRGRFHSFRLLPKGRK